MDKNILVIGSNSELARNTIKELKNKNYKIYATSRRIGMIEENVSEFHLDVTSEYDFIYLKERFSAIKFDTIINFAGIAIASAVEELEETELKKQLDVNLFGLLRIIKHFCPFLKENGKLINISSMASYGVFPFLSPYELSKASADILLNSYSIENNVKVVSIRPGAVATKFWENSIELNQNNFNNTSEKYKKEKEFLVQNAEYNSLKANNPFLVAKKIASIVELKNPRSVYNIGIDAKIAKLSRFVPQDILNKLIKTILKIRLHKNQNGKSNK